MSRRSLGEESFQAGSLRIASLCLQILWFSLLPLEVRRGAAKYVAAGMRILCQIGAHSRSEEWECEECRGCPRVT